MAANTDKAHRAVDAMADEIRSLRASLEIALADTARLNWVDEHSASLGWAPFPGWVVESPGGGVRACRTGMREAINAAMRAESREGVAT